MPRYTYEDEKGEQFELDCSIAEMEQFEKDNPQYKRVFMPIAMVDPVGVGVTKPPADFQKYVLGKVKQTAPGATAIANRRWTIPKEI